MVRRLPQIQCLSRGVCGRFRAWLRLGRLAAITLTSVARLALLPAARGGRSGGVESTRWARRLHRALGVRMTVHGRPDPDAAALVANHRSYLDVTALLAVTPCSLLAKSEVGQTPIFGRAAARAGTLFVQRESAGSRRQARMDLQTAIAEGRRVALFPEGTTTTGPGLLPFRAGFFIDAARADLRVQPVAIVCRPARAAYVVGDTFFSHFLTLFRRPTVEVIVAFGPTLADRDGTALREAAELWIGDRLIQMENPSARLQPGGSHEQGQQLPHRVPVPSGAIPG